MCRKKFIIEAHLNERFISGAVSNCILMLYPLKVNLNNWGYQLDVVFVSLTDCGFREVSRKRIYYNSYILNTASKLEKFHVLLTRHYKTKIYSLFVLFEQNFFNLATDENPKNFNII